MSIICDTQISKLAINPESRMITPFYPYQVNKADDITTGEAHSIISHGLSSYGYDALLDRKFKVFTNLDNSIVDPLNFDKNSFIEREGDSCIIPPNSFILGSTIEYFKIPKSIFALCLGKSTYARCGLVVNVTPLEPGWEGNVTIEISNTTPLPAKVYANQGICQFVFIKPDKICDVSYSDRGGKYQGQTGVTLPRKLANVCK